MKQCSDPVCPYVTAIDDKSFCPIHGTHLEDVTRELMAIEELVPCFCDKFLRQHDIFCSYCGQPADLARAAFYAREVN